MHLLFVQKGYRALHQHTMSGINPKELPRNHAIQMLRLHSDPEVAFGSVSVMSEVPVLSCEFDPLGPTSLSHSRHKRALG